MQIPLDMHGVFLLYIKQLFSSAAAFSGCFVVRRMMSRDGATREFGDWERHGVEHAAGVIVGGRDAFLVGYYVFGCRNQKLSRTDDANNREYSERYCQISSVVIIDNETTVHCGCDRFGNVVRTATAATVVLGALEDIYSKYNGVDDLNYCCGDVLFFTAELNLRAEIGEVSAGAEYAYVAFSSIKNDSLIQYGNSLKFLRSSVADASLECQLYIKADGYCVKASVELYGIKADVRLCYAYALYPYCGCMIDYFFPEVGKEYFGVFKAVAVSARVKYPVGFYTNSFLAYAGAARKSVILHKFSPYMFGMIEA